ncbi:MAG: Ig-like domain-containing protein, partial [Comamonadaceae bacterium]|nr:Ig-like domain-containing protein [Comamonadaceae bacterium]
LITPAPDVKMSVFLNGNTVIDAMPLAQAGTPVAGMAMLPATFKMGFSGSTGALHNTHEIRNLRVTKATLDAIDDTYAATPGQTLTVPLASGLGANDFGVLPASVFTLTTPSPNGNVTLNPNGGFSFTPDAGFSGTTTFRYQVCNGAVCDTATATITVQAAPGVTAVPVNAPWALILATLGIAGLACRRRA